MTILGITVMILLAFVAGALVAYQIVIRRYRGFVQPHMGLDAKDFKKLRDVNQQLHEINMDILRKLG